jgi:hypothetical protein
LNKITSKSSILDAALGLIIKGEASGLTFEKIALAANISVSDIEQYYVDVNTLTDELSARSLIEHKKNAELLLEQNGILGLRALISHDLQLFYGHEVNKTLLTPENTVNHNAAMKNFSKYFEREMPKIYTTFFKNNKDLLPNEEIEASFYGHFISHSLKFFNFETLKRYESTSEGRKTMTEQIIGSLFGKDSIDLPKF